MAPMPKLITLFKLTLALSLQPSSCKGVGPGLYGEVLDPDSLDVERVQFYMKSLFAHSMGDRQ